MNPEEEEKDQKMVQLSPYSYIQGKELKLNFCQKKKNEGELYGIDVAVIRVLAKYRLLNRSNLECAVRMLLPAKYREKPNYTKEINGLYEQGILLRYAYVENAQRSGRENLVLYGLTQKGYDTAAKKGIEVTHKQTDKGKRLTTAAALELASINQWHIATLYRYGDMVENEYYSDIRHVKGDVGVFIPSLIRLAGKTLLLGNTVTLIAFTYPKTKEGEGAFFNTLLGINTFTREREDFCVHPMYVVIVDSFKTMMEANDNIYAYALLRKLQIYYTLDVNTAGAGHLKWVYKCIRDINSNNVKLETVHIMRDTGKGE